MITRGNWCGKENRKNCRRWTDFDDWKRCVVLRRRVEGTFFVEPTETEQTKNAKNGILPVVKSSSGEKVAFSSQVFLHNFQVDAYAASVDVSNSTRVSSMW